MEYIKISIFCEPNSLRRANQSRKHAFRTEHIVYIFFSHLHGFTFILPDQGRAEDRWLQGSEHKVTEVEN